MQNYAKALIEFQHKCPAIDKDSDVEVRTKTGGTYRFKYASFGNIVQSIKGPMYQAKLGYTFLTIDGKFICRIMHESGEYSDTAIEMPKLKESMQENGSFLTYLKRYSLVLALGLDTDADDDGNLGEGHVATFKQAPKPIDPPKLKSEPIDDFFPAPVPQYIIQVGKFKGKNLYELDKLQVQNYITWINNNSDKPPQGAMLEFMKKAEEWL